MVGYKGGRITRIRVEDFMTYEHLEVFPKKGLNIVIGLNGSGKSSLMSAICLGLGGKPQYTGKSNQIADFIKHGKKKGSIEIELDDPVENIVIKRIIEGDTSRWLLNNSTVSYNDVMSAIQKYNIDVSNLCQFLPQEKVAEFSKMNSKHRLETMIQAIGEPKLHTDFNELKDLRVQLCELEKSLGSLEKSKATECQANDRLRVEVEKQEEKVKLQESLVLYKLQKKCLDYEETKLQITDMKNKKRALKTQLNKAEKDLHKYKMENSQLLSAYEQKVANIKSTNRTSTRYPEKLSNLQNQLSDLNAQVDNAKIEFQNRIDEVKKQKERLNDLEKQIVAYENFLKDSQGFLEEHEVKVQENTAENGRINDEIKIMSTNLENIKLEVNQHEYKSKAIHHYIAKIRNQQDQQMQVLKHRCKDTYEAVSWLLQNKGQFKSEICLPALISLQVFRDEDSKYIENMISLRDLKTIICTDKDDVKRLLDILSEQKGLKVNVALAPSSGLCFQSPPVTPELQGMGIKCFVADLFSAPDPVKRFMCDLYRLHKTPVGNERAEQHTDAILSSFGKFFTPNEKIAGSRSMYGRRNLTIKKDFIKKKHLIQSASKSSNQIQQLEREITESQKSADSLKFTAKTFERELAALEKEQEGIRRKRAELASKYKSYANTKATRDQKVELYNRKKVEVINEGEEERRMTSKIININKQRMKVLAVLNSLGSEFVDLKCQCAKDIIYVKVVKKELNFLEETLKQKEEEFNKIKREHDDADEAKRQLYRKGQEISNQLKTHPSFTKLDRIFRKLLESGNESKKVNSKSEEVSSQVWKTLNAHLPREELEDKIVKIEAQIDLNYDDNETVLQEYRSRQKQIESLCGSIEECRKKVRQLRMNIEEKKEDWLSSMLSHIAVINAKFSHYYKLLKCAGEISLDFGNDQDNFSEYGLQIRLKYRDNEPFTVLSPDHHSGGERNVASILFILSLKELSTVPFRCVDEINQGMDSTNERKMYEFIADDAAKTDSCSQYFLLTPKLLKDLKYQKDVAVHVIFNSRYLEAEMNIKKHIKKAIRV